MPSMDTTRSYWQGKRIRLRGIEPGDWVTYADWNLDDDQARRLSAVPFPQSRESVRRFAEAKSVRGPENDRYSFVVETNTGEAIGDVTTHDCDRRVGTFSYGLNILPEHRRQGYASDAIMLILRYYFWELRYQKATVGIYDFNVASIRLHERLGFQHEGRLRRMTYGNGVFSDLLMLGLTVDEFAPLAAERGFGPLPSPTP